MTVPFSEYAASLDTLAHLTLQVGRLLLLNGSDTELVQASMARFAAAFGVETNLLVSYEAVLVTLVAGDHVRTKIGCRGSVSECRRSRRSTAWSMTPAVGALVLTTS